MLDINITFFFQVANLLIMIVLFYWLLVKPTAKVLEERRQQVEGTGEAAKDLMEETQKRADDYERSLTEARIAAGKQKDQLRMEGIERENEIVKTARELSRKTVEDMKERIAAESRAASASMKEEIKILSAEITKKVLGREI
jgi:F-type H+-transporting ATPase subunit b